jgi:N6-adenosine-specific RNA methylase IME4
MNKKIIKIEQEEWYQSLIEDCQGILTEGIWNYRLTLIKTYHLLGKRILKENNNFERAGIYGKKIVSQVTQSLGQSERTIWRAIQFAKKYPDLDLLPEGKNISWHKICNQYLPEPKKEKTPELPKGKYQVIYADPPWQYAQEQHSKEKQDMVLETHYPTMPTEDICNLKVKDLTGENAVLFLWTTSPKLFECKQVIDAWGFNYKSSMVWDKVLHNVGYYVSVRHEFLLICTKGSCLPDIPKLQDSVVSEERTKHSEKPEVFYEIIENMYKGKKIELFARNARKGWDCWGNQLDG